jgi:hypothetical protein
VNTAESAGVVVPGLRIACAQHVFGGGDQSIFGSRPGLSREQGRIGKQESIHAGNGSAQQHR